MISARFDGFLLSQERQGADSKKQENFSKPKIYRY
jgi:hypothetical protein